MLCATHDRWGFEMRLSSSSVKCAVYHDRVPITALQLGQVVRHRSFEADVSQYEVPAPQMVASSAPAVKHVGREGIRNRGSQQQLPAAGEVRLYVIHLVSVIP